MESNRNWTISSNVLFSSASSTLEPIILRLLKQVLMNLIVLIPLCVFESWFYQRDLKKEWGYFGVTSSASAEEKLAHDRVVVNKTATVAGPEQKMEISSASLLATGTNGDQSSNGNNNVAWFRTKLLVCAFGLIGYHLLWGLFQERLVRTVYADGERFTSTTFLVFCSRLFGMLVSLLMVLKCSSVTVTTPSTVSSKGSTTSVLSLIPPLFVFALPSISNTLSSWCQLEALKHSSFPAQVIMKTFKMVPLIVIGTLMGKKYPFHEYIIAMIVACGVTLFVEGIKEATHTELVGDEVTASFLKVLYLVSDSFTAQWQETLFKEYRLTTYQMMLGMNVCSCFLALASLGVSNESTTAISFLYRHPSAIWHIVGFASSGAIGQIFIFETIKEFGAVPFALITTTRQIIAVVLSILVFGHHVTLLGWFGATAAFTSVLVRFAIVAKVNVCGEWLSSIRSWRSNNVNSRAVAPPRRYRKLESDV